MPERVNRLSSFLLVAVFIFCQSANAQFTVKFEIKAKPANHPQDSLYVAGSFNSWNPGLKSSAFRRNDAGNWVAETKEIPPGIIEYKITRGNWATTEVSAKGTAINNRYCNVISDTLISLSIEAWADDFPARPPVSTRSKNVFIIDTAFFIPQLNRKRRIWIYLPEDYAFTKKRYPVLYMHDGQNLFDAVTSSYGEWGVDEIMDSIASRKQFIIVGVDHGGDKRLNEYNPYDSRFGKGEGDAYVDFLVKTLKPFIDLRYRTQSEKKSTMIAGSSMGGLISMYSVLKYPDVFGGAGIFSPAFWVAPQIYQKADSSKKITISVYFVCGEQESNEMVADMKKMYISLKQNGVEKLFYKQVKDGKHNELFWHKELPAFFQWMYNSQIK